MGCGLSQLSISHRARVLEEMVAVKKTAPSPSPASISVNQTSSFLLSSPRKTPIISKKAKLALVVETKKAVGTGSGGSKTAVKATEISANVAVGTGWQFHKPFLVSDVPLIPSNYGSAKSLSDHDSGYKDDSNPEDLPSELDVTPSSSPRSKAANKSQLPTMIINVASVDENREANDCTAAHSNPVPQLCSCGFSHIKQDGYVEAYDDGYLDSSYEELRSLAHDGSVFSIDILCHTSIDGSQRYHKVPLFVHKPVGTSIDNDNLERNSKPFPHLERRHFGQSMSSKNGRVMEFQNYYFQRSVSAAGWHSNRRRRQLSFDEDMVAGADESGTGSRNRMRTTVPGTENHTSEYEIKTLAD